MPNETMSLRKRYLKVMQVRSHAQHCKVLINRVIVQRYHSDKNLASVYGEQWAALAEEISKALGTFYNRMKEVS
jgi:hypothetical protein